MSDRSVSALTNVVIDGTDRALVKLLVDVMTADPTFVLWTACIADRDEFQPNSVEQLAEWLTANSLNVLQWNTARGDRFEAPESGESDKWAARVRVALEVAETAAARDGIQDDIATSEAYLLGLLHEPDKLLKLAADDSSEKYTKTCLPDWLTQKSIQLPVDVPDECKQRAADAHKRWLRTVHGIGNQLPVLTSRLARLDTLEHRFQKTLEIEKLESVAEFAAGAGHEINNPLAVIAGRAQLFLQDETDPERRRELALINAQAKRVFEMIADMRQFARPPKPMPEQIDLVPLVDEVLVKVNADCSDQAITATRTSGDDPVELEADPTQMAVALRALCKNSVEAIGHGGTIEINIVGDERHVSLIVIDTGPGISPDVRRHLFDPFYSARQAGRGLGLGLSKCWQIVKNHGGTIDVDSQEGQGSRFTITLPRKQPT